MPLRQSPPFNLGGATRTVEVEPLKGFLFAHDFLPEKVATFVLKIVIEVSHALTTETFQSGLLRLQVAAEVLVY